MEKFKNPVLNTTLMVVKRAKDVKINRGRIKAVALDWSREEIDIPSWPKDMHLETPDMRRKLDYLILLDGLNFCFWSKDRKKKWRINYRGKEYNGYFSLSLSLKRFFEKYPRKANFNYLQKISFEEFKKMLTGRGHLLLLKKRWQILRAISREMLRSYDGDSLKLITAAQKRFSRLVPLISKLPSFNDLANYKNSKVYILKRAQILACDIYGAFDHAGPGEFIDPEYLTAFADYKVPQILQTLGILEYSDNLTRAIKNKILIKAGSDAELEIRTCTIWAVEYLRRELEKCGKKLLAHEIDWILWNNAKNENMTLPYHLTKTFFY